MMVVLWVGSLRHWHKRIWRPHLHIYVLEDIGALKVVISVERMSLLETGVNSSSINSDRNDALQRWCLSMATVALFLLMLDGTSSPVREVLLELD
jgi:hypothetical protein